MKIELRSDKPVDDATCKAGTGLTMSADADGMRRAWGESLDRLRVVVEG